MLFDTSWCMFWLQGLLSNSIALEIKNESPSNVRWMGKCLNVTGWITYMPSIINSPNKMDFLTSVHNELEMK